MYTSRMRKVVQDSAYEGNTVFSHVPFNSLVYPVFGIYICQNISPNCLLYCLHLSIFCRDSTVQSLTTQPSVEEGKIVYKDSPLVVVDSY